MNILSILPLWYVATVAGVFGAVIGSFLNVVIYRVPNGGTLMGRSYCPKCDHLIRGYDNIPVLTWFFLGGKCRDCKAPISWRYPTIEAAHAAAWVGIVLAFLPQHAALVPLLLFFSSVSVALFMIDFDTMRLPNVITYPAFIITAIYLSVLAIVKGEFTLLAHAGLGALAMGAFFFALWYFSKGRGLGFGDVKLSLTLGLILGWLGAGPLIVGTFASFVIGGIPAGILLATGILKRGTQIPFGPMLLVGTWVGIVWGQDITTAYLKVSGLG